MNFSQYPISTVPKMQAKKIYSTDRTFGKGINVKQMAILLTDVTYGWSLLMPLAGLLRAAVVPSGVFEKLELDCLPDEPCQPLLPPERRYPRGASQLGEVPG